MLCIVLYIALLRLVISSSHSTGLLDLRNEYECISVCMHACTYVCIINNMFESSIGLRLYYYINLLTYSMVQSPS